MFWRFFSSRPIVFRDRLSASDMLQVRKVMEHVYEKIINLDTESQTTSSSANDKPGEQEKEEDVAVMAEEKIELMCLDQVRPAITFFTALSAPVYSLFALQHFIFLRCRNKCKWGDHYLVLIAKQLTFVSAVL